MRFLARVNIQVAPLPEICVVVSANFEDAPRAPLKLRVPRGPARDTGVPPIALLAS